MAPIQEAILPLLQGTPSGAVFFRPLRDDEDIWFATEGCILSPEQKEFVNSGGFSLGRAYLHPQNHFPCIICSRQGAPVGFLLFNRWPGHYSWSYFIDLRQQGKGYGTAAAQLALEILKEAFPGGQIRLSVEVSNRNAQALYRRLGFHQLDELDGDDLVFGL